MAFKPNYRLQRADRSRAAQARSEEKQRKKMQASGLEFLKMKEGSVIGFGCVRVNCLKIEMQGQLETFRISLQI